MVVYTDNPRFAASFLPPGMTSELAPGVVCDPGLEPVLDRVLSGAGPLHSAHAPDVSWPHLALSEFSDGSQYDKVIEMARQGPPMPHGLACLAGSGRGFHGFKGRRWASVPGNLHLVAHFTPLRAVESFEIAFTILAALSVVDALAQIDGFQERPGIKWINDVTVGGAKLAGVISAAQSRGARITRPPKTSPMH